MVGQFSSPAVGINLAKSSSLPWRSGGSRGTTGGGDGGTRGGQREGKGNGRRGMREGVRGKDGQGWGKDVEGGRKVSSVTCNFEEPERHTAAIAHHTWCVAGVKSRR